MDFRIIKKAGITTAEAASIVGVSAVMMWKYMAGESEPRELFKGVPIRLRTRVLLAVLTKLVDNKSLPKKAIAFHKRMTEEHKQKRLVLVEKLKKLVDDRVVAALANE